MTLKQFIKEYREEIDMIIAEKLGLKENPRPNDRERELWIMNDAEMYYWAKRYKVVL